MQKQSIFKIKGMGRDLSVSSFNPEFAYENKNIRIMATNENTLLSIINEKGPKKLYINNIGESILGEPIGISQMNDNIILFSSGLSVIDNISAEEKEISDIIGTEEELDINSNSEDRIYKLWFENNQLNGKILFKGYLNFNSEYPIESISVYENDTIKKIYWTDGLNQLRVINIEKVNQNIDARTFDFVRYNTLKEELNIEKIDNGSGIFPSGVIQYAITYYNKYGQESNIINISPLYYISSYNKGNSADSTINNSFKITVGNVDTTWEYIRIYSIIRTSIDSTPEVKKLTDIKTTSTISYIDNNIGESIDPTYLLYVGGEEIIAKTISYKDNTLFAGNIEIKRRAISDTIKTFFSGKEVDYNYSENKRIKYNKISGYYSYESQLDKSSEHIKYFKYLEWYRFGLQFQHYTGKWSDPVFLCDKQNTLHIIDEDNTLSLPIARYTINNSDILKELISLGYIRVRPVIVYPELKDRECICQGVLNPTVYNIQDRYNNSPFAQASWFFRPNAAFDKDTSKTDYNAFPNSGYKTPSIYSKAGTYQDDIRKIIGYENTLVDGVNKGTWITFKHNNPIPDNKNRNAEIQCIQNPPVKPVLAIEGTTETDIINWVSYNSENYYIDQSIVTLNSPDIELNTELNNLDLSNLKLRIVGYIPITGFISDIDIQTSTSPLVYKGTKDIAVGFYKEQIAETNTSILGFRALSSAPYWFDEIYARKADGNPNRYSTGFAIYPWHRNGSLNNQKYNDSNGGRSAKLKTKKMSNLRFSYKTNFLDTIWKAYDSEDTNKNGCSVKLFNSNEVVNIKLDAPTNSDIEGINYYGNIDKVLTISREGDKKSYPIVISGVGDSSSFHTIFGRTYEALATKDTDYINGIDPISIKYKSTPHAVITLNNTSSKKQHVLPTSKERTLVPGGSGPDEWVVNPVSENDTSNFIYYSKKKLPYGVYQDTINIYPNYGYLWLGELYNDNVLNRFGGDSPEAIENNKWLPCGKSVSLEGASITIEWLEGDTYYQRYDCLKTYPFTLEDQNSIVEILSFMCETRVNLDGRYDDNRGQTNNLVMTPNNFNLLNNIYSQQNNFFSYRILDSDLNKLNTFKNTVTWSKTKTLGEEIDTWTNLNLTSTLDLDGDKGEIRSIKRFNNELIAFQDTGISNILFNSRTQLSTTNGVPIEIANSGKVDGKRYITENIGCQNKWSICTTSNGIYFIDDITKGIYLFNGKLDNLSDRLGFHSWINSKSTGINIWNPKDFKGFVTYYDKVNGDVFFISKEECLAFSEPLGQFTSFYSYENSPYFFNIEDKGIFIHKDIDKNNKLWEHNEGDYNIFFNGYKPFYTTVIANADYGKDKIFNTLEFRADSWNSSGTLLNTTFDTLEVWNEYQSGKNNLINIPNKPSTLKRKFRIWRANIPRDSSNNRDRIRNPWIYLKLSMNKENTDKTILQDMVISYFI